MSKTKKKTNRRTNVTELIGRFQANCDRLTEIADTCERENRPRNDAETAEAETIGRENSMLMMRVQAAQAESLTVREYDPDAMLRESLDARIPATIVLTRDLQMSDSVDGTGLIPIDEQEMLKPLRAGLIWDKVGLSIRSGLPKGTLRWPIHGKAKAVWLAEGERVGDSKIDFSKLECQPERLSCAIPLTKELLDSTGGVVESVVREEMPAAVIDLINEDLFSPVGTYTDKEGKTKQKRICGPFVEAAKNPFKFAGEVPTRRELLLMKASVATEGIELGTGCWVMTETMKAELEDLKVDAGSGRFVCEGDRIFGMPVFVTPSIGEGNIGFGVWGYQAAGFMGGMSLTVDPYTLSRQNSTDFVLNGHFATVTLRQEAFVLGVATKTEEPQTPPQEQTPPQTPED